MNSCQLQVKRLNIQQISRSFSLSHFQKKRWCFPPFSKNKLHEHFLQEKKREGTSWNIESFANFNEVNIRGANEVGEVTGSRIKLYTLTHKKKLINSIARRQAKKKKKYESVPLIILTYFSCVSCALQSKSTHVFIANVPP